MRGLPGSQITQKLTLTPWKYNFLSHFFVNFHDLRTFSTILDGGSTILDGGSTILDGSSTIFCRFSPFFIDFHDLRTFVAIYILSRFTHFFRKFFLAKIAISATSHVFCMYVNPPPPHFRKIILQIF